MALNAARLPARLDAAGDLLPWLEQDRSRWNQRLLAEGLTLFERSTTGDELSVYHVEAAIAVAHVSAPGVAETDWNAIVSLYDRLFQLAPSPVVALNRAIALGQRDGAASALEELQLIANVERLSAYPFYPAALGEFELRLGHFAAARNHFRRALDLCRNDTERRFLEKKLAAASD
jgi:RNA polymerase sigma-70 factor (ECF subfamily)